MSNPRTCESTPSAPNGSKRPGVPEVSGGGPSALLRRFYARAGLATPRLRLVQGPDLPEPYKSLLVHSMDMTPTLRSFHGRELQVSVLGRERQGDAYWREVVLQRAGDLVAVEYGVIRICLALLPPAAAERVLEERWPLGKILQEEAIAHLSWPQAFFRVEADARLSELLGVNPAATLYGRRNVLVDGSRRLLAEVIEILPP
jgi:hypothetical protein